LYRRDTGKELGEQGKVEQKTPHTRKKEVHRGRATKREINGDVEEQR